MSVFIILDNNQNVFFPGQTIAGRVECNFDKNKTLRAIRIKFKGYAKVEFNETESDSSGENTHFRNITYIAEEEYFNAEYNLVQGGNDFSLSAGQHVYPFSYVLPTQLPSSFQRSRGKVEYYIKATVDRPWKFDYEAKCLLIIVSSLDLNCISGLREPLAVADEKTMCSCWCNNNSGALTFNIGLPISGYAPGQSVNITASIQNLTSVRVKRVEFNIIEISKFTSKYPRANYQTERYQLTGCCEEGIKAHREKSWTSTLIIPTVRAYTNLQYCNIIETSYKLTAKAVVPYPHKSLKLEIPIHIGHVPLLDVDASLLGFSSPKTSHSSSPAVGFSYPPPEKQDSYVPPPTESYPLPAETLCSLSGDTHYPYSPSEASYPPVPGWISEPSKNISALTPPAYENNFTGDEEKI